MPFLAWLVGLPAAFTAFVGSTLAAITIYKLAAVTIIIAVSYMITDFFVSQFFSIIVNIGQFFPADFVYLVSFFLPSNIPACVQAIALFSMYRFMYDFAKSNLSLFSHSV